MSRARPRIVKVPLVFAAFMLIAGSASGDPGGWYGARGAVAPRGDKIIICHGYGCVYRKAFVFSRADRARLRRILRAGRRSPAAERKAVSVAVRWFERRVRHAFGLARDLARSPVGLSGRPGQMDCIDEATNTTSLLLIAQRIGGLVHHVVGAPASRGFLLDGRGPHATAVLAEKKGGRRFVVDSWVGATGDAPQIMPVERWLRGGGAS